MEPRKVCPRCGTAFDAAAAFCQRDGSRLVVEGPLADPYVGRLLLGQFRVDQVIGTGGMGTVYRAYQAALERDVAIKILHRELVQNPDASRRFQREARVAASLEHPNLVRVFLFGELPDGSLYLVMEHLDGRSLLEVLRQEGPLSLRRAVFLAAQICDGVAAAHARGVVHRDIKPENVMVLPRGGEGDFVKVLDFGIARLLWGEQTHLTQSGVIFGTARYISPEGASGEDTDARSDVYSIAVLAYQLLSGETPFDAASPVALLMKHVHQAAPDVRSRPGGSHVPPLVADVIMRALSKHPDARQVDAAELAHALRTAALRSGLELLPSGTGRGVAVAHVPAALTPATSLLADSGSSHAAPMGGLPSGPPSGSIAGLRTGPSLATTALLAFVLGASAVGLGAFIVHQVGARLASPVSASAPVEAPLPAAPAAAAPTPPPVAAPTIAIALRAAPLQPRVGEAVSLTASGVPTGSSPRFEVACDGRTLATLTPDRGAGEGAYAARHVFDAAGTYRISFHPGAGGAPTALTLQVRERAERLERVSSRRASRAIPEPYTPPPPPPSSAPTSMAPTGPPGSDAIDWSVPPVPRVDPLPPPRVITPVPPPPPPADEPPAPWTGGAEL